MTHTIKISNNDLGEVSVDELAKYLEQWDPTHYKKHEPCDHAPVDTGFRKSWCKHCDADMIMRSDGRWELK